MTTLEIQVYQYDIISYVESEAIRNIYRMYKLFNRWI